MRISFFVSMFVLVAIISITYAETGDEGIVLRPLIAPDCEVKTSCDTNQTCWLTLSGFVDAHVSDCTNDPYNYKLCCNENYGARHSSFCTASEFDLLTFSAITGDAHVASIFDPYTQHLCVSSTNSRPLNCAVKLTSQATIEDECELSMSGTDDAHAASCSDPYNYALFCELNTFPAYAAHTLTVSLRVNVPEYIASVESVGTLQPSQISSAQYTGSYGLLNKERTVFGVVAFEKGSRDRILLSNTGVIESIGVQQPIQRNRMLAIFTETDIDAVRERVAQGLAVTGQTTESFGQPVIDAKHIHIGVDGRAAIDFQGNETFSPGTHRIEIRKVDTINGIPIVRISKE